MSTGLTIQNPSDTEAVEALYEQYSGSYDLWVDPIALYKLMQREKVYEAGFREALKLCDEYAVHLHIQGCRLDPVPECVEAKRLLDSQEHPSEYPSNQKEEK